jgi:hypothetical protein
MENSPLRADAPLSLFPFLEIHSFTISLISIQNRSDFMRLYPTLSDSIRLYPTLSDSIALYRTPSHSIALYQMWASDVTR